MPDYDRLRDVAVRSFWEQYVTCVMLTGSYPLVLPLHPMAAAAVWN